MNRMDKEKHVKRGYLEEDYKIFYLEDIVSKEIEYCSENIDTILDSSYTYDAMKADRLISVL